MQTTAKVKKMALIADAVVISSANNWGQFEAKLL
jgi:hypothetical protein